MHTTLLEEKEHLPLPSCLPLWLTVLPSSIVLNDRCRSLDTRYAELQVRSELSEQSLM